MFGAFAPDILNPLQTTCLKEVRVKDTKSLFYTCMIGVVLQSHKNKDTENDASKAGRYSHPWVTLPSDGDVRKAV